MGDLGPAPSAWILPREKRVWGVRPPHNQIFQVSKTFIRPSRGPQKASKGSEITFRLPFKDLCTALKMPSKPLQRRLIKTYKWSLKRFKVASWVLGSSAGEMNSSTQQANLGLQRPSSKQLNPRGGWAYTLGFDCKAEGIAHLSLSFPGPHGLPSLSTLKSL